MGRVGDLTTLTERLRHFRIQRRQPPRDLREKAHTEYGELTHCPYGWCDLPGYHRAPFVPTQREIIAHIATAHVFTLDEFQRQRGVKVGDIAYPGAVVRGMTERARLKGDYILEEEAGRR